jgi:hypothetical protein
MELAFCDFRWHAFNPARRGENVLHLASICPPFPHGQTLSGDDGLTSWVGQQHLVTLIPVMRLAAFDPIVPGFLGHAP